MREGAFVTVIGKMFVVCGPDLQTSAAEEVDQTSSICQKKTFCFLTSTSC
ncbi:hypothetical protein Hanom_Chr11g01012021 [Helianthus anomalus]